MSLAIGQQVKLVQLVVAGEITDTRFNKEASQLEHMLTFTDSAGEEQHRWFLESELEAA